jgi:hypothetical protein
MKKLMLLGIIGALMCGAYACGGDTEDSKPDGTGGDSGTGGNAGIGGNAGTGGGTTELNPVSWQTSTASLTADDFLIVADGKHFTAKGATVEVNSDPGSSDSTTLELEWEEQSVEMRLNLYISADPQHWWVSEMRTYNAQTSSDADWLTYDGPFFKSPIGTTYSGDVNLTNDASDPYRGELHIHGMKLSTTLTGL